MGVGTTVVIQGILQPVFSAFRVLIYHVHCMFIVHVHVLLFYLAQNYFMCFDKMLSSLKNVLEKVGGFSKPFRR